MLQRLLQHVMVGSERTGEKRRENRRASADVTVRKRERERSERLLQTPVEARNRETLAPLRRLPF